MFIMTLHVYSTPIPFLPLKLGKLTASNKVQRKNQLMPFVSFMELLLICGAQLQSPVDCTQFVILEAGS